MTGLSHEQTKKFLHVAADHCLNPNDRALVDTHLAQCANCRGYAQELEHLDTAIARALRVKWAAPYRSPIDMAGRVRQQLRANAERKLLLGVTNALVKIGSLAVGTALVVGLFSNQQTLQHPLSATTPQTSSGMMSNLSPFELKDMLISQEGIAPPVLLDDNKLPGMPSSRLRASPY